MADRFQMVRWALFVLVVSVGVNGALVWWAWRVPAEPLVLVEPTPAPTPTPVPLTVYVSGAVKQPGVYQLPAGSRVVDAVAAAGGMTDEAVPEAVNQAAPLQDGVQVHVPSREEVSAGAPVVSQARGPSSTAGAGGLVNINTAGPDELEALPGIGPTLAARIVEDRMANGPFTTVEELTRVKGIGNKLLERLRPYITVGP